MPKITMTLSDFNGKLQIVAHYDVVLYLIIILFFFLSFPLLCVTFIFSFCISVFSATVDLTITEDAEIKTTIKRDQQIKLWLVCHKKINNLDLNDQVVGSLMISCQHSCQLRFSLNLKIYLKNYFNLILFAHIHNIFFYYWTAFGCHAYLYLDVWVYFFFYSNLFKSSLLTANRGKKKWTKNLQQATPKFMATLNRVTLKMIPTLSCGHSILSSILVTWDISFCMAGHLLLSPAARNQRAQWSEPCRCGVPLRIN